MTPNNNGRITLAIINTKLEYIQKDIKAIKECMESKVDKDYCLEHMKDYKNTKDMVGSHEKNWNRLVGYMIGAGASGGIVGGLLVKAVSALTVMAFGG